MKGLEHVFFLSFTLIFFPELTIFQSSTMPSAAHFEKSPNMGKKIGGENDFIRKFFVKLAFKPFIPWRQESLKPAEFRVFEPSSLYSLPYSLFALDSTWLLQHTVHKQGLRRSK